MLPALRGKVGAASQRTLHPKVAYRHQEGSAWTLGTECGGSVCSARAQEASLDWDISTALTISSVLMQAGREGDSEETEAQGSDTVRSSSWD